MEKGIFTQPSKKFWMWLIAFLGIAGVTIYATHVQADRWIVIAGIGGMALVSMCGIFGLAFMDSVIRGVRAWRQLPPGESDG